MYFIKLEPRARPFNWISHQQMSKQREGELYPRPPTYLIKLVHKKTKLLQFLPLSLFPLTRIVQTRQKLDLSSPICYTSFLRLLRNHLFFVQGKDWVKNQLKANCIAEAPEVVLRKKYTAAARPICIDGKGRELWLLSLNSLLNKAKISQLHSNYFGKHLSKYYFIV